MVSCPYAALMPGSMDSRLWTVNELISSLQCYTCYNDVINAWAPCIRQAAQVNTHPNLCSRGRQIWFLIFIFMKYLKGESEFDDEDFIFQGPHAIQHHRYNPTDSDRRRLIKNVPKQLQCSTIITRGNFLDFYF